MVERAHEAVFRDRPKALPSELNSTWNDTNVFSEAGIPAAKYGPFSIRQQPGAGFGAGAAPQVYRTPGICVKDLVAAAKVYALVMVQTCGEGAAAPERS